MPYVLGIDVGTTYTSAALWRDGQVSTVPLGNRANTIPSVVLLRDDGTLLVGEAAQRRAVAEPDRVAREFKRRIGDDVPLTLADRQFTPEALTGEIIGAVVAHVTKTEGEPPSHVTLTCPASWGEHRRSLLQTAAEQAGLPASGLLDEPTAAAIYYASQERVETGAVVGIYDLGGGTFDAAVLRKTDGGFEFAGDPAGDDDLGGIDFDDMLFRYVTRMLGNAWKRLDANNDGVVAAVAQLRQEVVDAKEALSSDVDARVHVMLPDFTTDLRITRREFEDLIRIPLLQTVDTFRRAVTNAGVAPSDLRNVLLVGGSSRIPLISELLASELRVPVAVDAHPKFAVCLGAAIAAAARVDAGAAVIARPTPTTAPPTGAPPRPAVPTDTGATSESEEAILDALVAPPIEATPVPEPALAPAAPVADAPVADSTLDDAARRLIDRAPEVTLTADLDRHGLTDVADVPLAPAVAARRRAVAMDDLTVSVTVGEDAGYGRDARKPILVGLAALAVVAVIVAAVVVHAHSTQSASASVPTTMVPVGSGGTDAPVATVPLTPDVLTSATDQMRAVAGINGATVAVGCTGASSCEDENARPLVWTRAATGWTRQPKAVAGAHPGAMLGVRSLPNGAIAVGWTAGADGARQPAFWRSTDNGASWNLLAPPQDDPGTTGEVRDLVTARDGTMIAVGFASPRGSGALEGAVWKSNDGLTWTRVPSVNGFTGASPSRVIEDGAGGFLAIGKSTDDQSPALWSSTDDGAQWSQRSADFDTQGLVAWIDTIAPLGNGAYVAAGSLHSPTENDRATIWTTKNLRTWKPAIVSSGGGTVGGGWIHDLLPAGGTVTAVGQAGDANNPGATVWTGNLPAAVIR
jgi:actin-like ATPase involved in cell morphogenesis